LFLIDPAFLLQAFLVCALCFEWKCRSVFLNRKPVLQVWE